MGRPIAFIRWWLALVLPAVMVSHDGWAAEVGAAGFPARWASVVLDSRGSPAAGKKEATGINEESVVLQMVRFLSAQDPDLEDKMKILGDMARQAYADMARNPEFAGLPSALDPAISGAHSAPCHYFVFTPEGCSPKEAAKGADRKWPLMIFLHGAGGNMKVGPWGFAAEAARRPCIMVFPSYGNGIWWITPGLPISPVKLPLPRPFSMPWSSW